MADGEARKGQPIATGVLAYFPNALAAVSECSRIGNDKHSPGAPLHWAREKSTGEADAAARHLIDALAHGPLTLNDDGIPHVVAFAWRALAFAERALTHDDRWRGGAVRRDTERAPALDAQADAEAHGLIAPPGVLVPHEPEGF